MLLCAEDSNLVEHHRLHLVGDGVGFFLTLAVADEVQLLADGVCWIGGSVWKEAPCENSAARSPAYLPKTIRSSK